MKKTLALLILLPLALFAAAPVVTIDDGGYCFIDGVNAGLAGDCIVNHPQHAPAVNLAMRTHHAKVQADATTAAKTAQKGADEAVAKAQEEARATIKAAKEAAEKATKEANDAIATARNDVRTARQEAAEAHAARKKESDRVAAIVAELKGVAPMILPPSARAALLDAREKERAALLAAKADAEAKLAELP